MAGRIVRRSLAKREGEYAGEVRRLLDAALEVMQRPRYLLAATRGRHRGRRGPFERRLLPALSLQGRPRQRFARRRCRASARVSGPPDGQGPPARGAGSPLGRGCPRPGRWGRCRRHVGRAVERQQRRRWPGGRPPLRRARRSPLCSTIHSPSSAATRPSSMRPSPRMRPLACCRTASGVARGPDRAKPTASSTSACAPSGADPSASAAARFRRTWRRRCPAPPLSPSLRPGLRGPRRAAASP